MVLFFGKSIGIWYLYWYWYLILVLVLILLVVLSCIDAPLQLAQLGPKIHDELDTKDYRSLEREDVPAYEILSRLRGWTGKWFNTPMCVCVCVCVCV